MFLCLISILFNMVLGQNSSFDVQLRKYLDNKLSSFVKYEYQVTGIPKKYSKLEIDGDKNSSISKNFIYVPVKVYENEKIVSNSVLTIKVKLFKNVYVAKQEIRRGENLNESSFNIKEADVSMFVEKTLEANDEINGLRSKVLIKEGMILTENMAEPIPVVNKGDNLTLHTAGAGVDITVEVIARQEGCIGDIITVHAKGSRLYKAKILDKKNLKLVE